MKFDKAFEEAVLSKALKDASYLKKAARILDDHHFNTPQHAWVWSKIKSTWNEYREVITKRLLIAKTKEDFTKSEDREPYVELARRLSKSKPKAADASLEELSKFVRAVNAQISLEQAAKSLERGDLEKTYETLRQLASKDLKPREYSHVQWIEGFEERQADRKRRKEHPEDHKVVPTGFKTLDGIIGGIQPGELGLILATTGKGKSILLNNFLYTAVKKEFNGVYFAFEMPAKQVAMRQDARWLGIPYKKFKNYDFSTKELRSIDRRYKKVKSKWENKAHILSLPIRGADMNSVRAALDDLQQDFGFRADVIFMDSGDHLKATRRYESFRLEQAAVYWDMKALAEDEGYGIWSSTHAGREWADSVATSEATGESYDKARIADMVISLNTPKDHSRSTKSKIESDDGDEEESTEKAGGEEVNLFLAKYRDGVSRRTIPMDADFSRILIEELETSEEKESE